MKANEIRRIKVEIGIVKCDRNRDGGSMKALEESQTRLYNKLIRFRWPKQLMVQYFYMKPMWLQKRIYIYIYIYMPLKKKLILLLRAGV